jgi:hypothetical protein
MIRSTITMEIRIRTPKIRSSLSPNIGRIAWVKDIVDPLALQMRGSPPCLKVTGETITRVSFVELSKLERKNIYSARAEPVILSDWSVVM